MERAAHRSGKPEYQRARELRKTQTPVEKKIWDLLRQTAKASGFKFRRQHPIAPYIVDFVCLKAKIIVEIDGFSHDLRVEYDQKRSEYLTSLGYAVLRFSNEVVSRNL